MISAYELSGTGDLLDINGEGVLGADPGDPYFQEHLNSNYTWSEIDYPRAAYPMETSIATGVTNLISAVNSTPGEFVFIATSQGAIVASNVYDQIRSGSLMSRNSDFLGGVMFGNPRRQGGHTFPGCSDPGGNGIDHGNLLSGSETRWYEFANPGDYVAVNDNTTTSGKIYTGLFNVLNQTAPDVSLLGDLFTNGFSVVTEQFYDLFSILSDVSTGPHTEYGTTTPLGDGRSCMKIALDYLNSLS